MQFYHNNVEVESIFGDHGKGTYKHYFSTQSKNGANGGIVSTDKVYFYSYDQIKRSIMLRLCIKKEILWN